MIVIARLHPLDEGHVRISGFQSNHRLDRTALIILPDQVPIQDPVAVAGLNSGESQPGSVNHVAGNDFCYGSCNHGRVVTGLL